MSRSITLELPDDQAATLERVAATLHRTPGEALAMLTREALLHEQFPQVEFRDSASGRQAYVAGSSLAVWEVVMVAEAYALDPSLTAAHLHWSAPRVEAVLAYAQACPADIERALAENREMRPADVRKLLPNAIWT